jgi:hypothetical protein
MGDTPARPPTLAAESHSGQTRHQSRAYRFTYSSGSQNPISPTATS